jgi:hypothetical protein
MKRNSATEAQEKGIKYPKFYPILLKKGAKGKGALLATYFLKHSIRF